MAWPLVPFFITDQGEGMSAKELICAPGFTSISLPYSVPPAQRRGGVRPHVISTERIQRTDPLATPAQCGHPQRQRDGTFNM
jgi:hypothetical protein